MSWGSSDFLNKPIEPKRNKFRWKQTENVGANDSLLTLSKKETCNSEEHIAGSYVDELHLGSLQWFCKAFPGNKTKNAYSDACLEHVFPPFACNKSYFLDYFMWVLALFL